MRAIGGEPTSRPSDHRAALAWERRRADDWAIALHADDEVFAHGERVEVRQRFDGRWARGFVVEAASDDGVVVRREADDRVLPDRFARDEVRLERRRGGMWWA